METQHACYCYTSTWNHFAVYVSILTQFLDKPHLSKHYTQYLHLLVIFYPPCIWSSMSNFAEWNIGVNWSMGLHSKQCPNTTHDIWNHVLYKLYFSITLPIPGVSRSKAWVCVAPCLLGLRDRIPPGHGSLSLVSIVYCQVETFVSGWSLVQESYQE
jgi:hypothetical protein